MTHTETRTTYSYEAYMALTEQLVAEGRTTGPVQSEAMANYTKINLQRMRRLNKTLELRSDLIRAIQAIRGPYTFRVLTEPWCGDAAQNVPILAKIAESSPHIHLELILRDDNLDLMDQYLTNGGRSIPKLIAVHQPSGEVRATWGPRPAPVQQMVMDRKNLDPAVAPPYTEFVEVVQKWYNRDKTQTAQDELLEVLQALG